MKHDLKSELPMIALDAARSYISQAAVIGGDPVEVRCALLYSCGYVMGLGMMKEANEDTMQALRSLLIKAFDAGFKAGRDDR